MRYLKVFFLVLVFFIVMLFFVQNQSSFADPVVLKLDLMFVPIMESLPIPMYALMLICFTLGGGLVLLMLMWDRVALSARCSAAKSKATSLARKLEKVEASIKQQAEKAETNFKQQLEKTETTLKQQLEKAEQKETSLQAELKDVKEKLAQAIQSHTKPAGNPQ